MKTILAIVEIVLAIVTFLLVLNLTTSVMAYYQQSTESMIHMMDRLEENIPTNYTNPYDAIPDGLIPGLR